MTALLRVLALLITSPLLLLGASTWFGYALGQGSNPIFAGLFSALMFILPALGLGALGRFSPAAILTGGLMWGLFALGAGSLYFPGERAQALERGLSWAQGDARGSGVVLGGMTTFGGWVLPLLGEDPAPPTLAMPVMTPAPPVVTTRLDSPGGGDDLDPVVRLPVDNFKGSIRVPVTLIGPQGRQQVEMIFDTGATMTTLEPKVAKALGIDLPKDLPRITLNTAGGSRDVRVGFVDAVELRGGDGSGVTEVPGVSVAVCRGCSGEDTAGLLGLNVTSLFQVTMDYEGGGIELRPRGEALDRLTDIRHWLDVKSQASQGAFGPVEVELEVTNKGPRLVQQVDVEVSCKSRSFSIQLDDIPPGGTGKTEVSIPRDSDCGRYKLALIGGRW